MASLQDQAETAKAAVASIATCTPATTVLLKELLLPKDLQGSSTSTTKETKTSKSARATTNTKQNEAASSTDGKKAAGEDKPELSAKEKALLATHVINATLKSLGDAAKVPVSPTPGKDDSTKTASRRRIRRSNSAPLTPMRPRDLNSVPTSPEITKKSAKPAKSLPNASTCCLSTVECARVAFSALRSLQSAAKITLPEFQLEAGMSSLVAKLISLGLMEHAVKELRVLKKRLAELGGTDKKATKAVPGMLSLAEILDLGNMKASGQILNLVVTTQIQVLRILSNSKRPADIEAAMPFLRGTDKSSPVNLLLQTAETSETEKTKAARQLEAVSQLMLALAPSISNSEDNAASEPKLSIRPVRALEVQTIAFQTRLCWWKLASHKADVDREILAPFSRCIAAYVRRAGQAGPWIYQTCLAAFNNISDQVYRQQLQPSNSSNSPLSNMYQILGKLARDSGQHSEAVKWAEKINEIIDRTRDSAAKCISTAAFLLAYRLRVAWKYPSQDELLKEVVDGLQGALRGDSAELDELLESLVLVRRSATNLLIGNLTDDNGKKYQPSKDASELLETFILQLPRFCLRWLGKRPSSIDNSKDFIRFEQRRKVLGESASQILDSALMLTKTGIDEKRIAWEKLDSLLEDCLRLLDNLWGLTSVDSSNHYYAKISHLYYMQHTIFITLEPKPTKNGKTFAYALRALRRSIDCVKDRPKKEREKAQVLYKIERISDLYRDSGRLEHALASLQTLRSLLIEDGALASVAEALKTRPPRNAWALNQEVQALAWTIRSIVRTEKVWSDWTSHLEEPERLAALEYGLDCEISKKGTGIDPLDPAVVKILELCTAERFPVRRLRVFLRVLIANVGNETYLTMIQAQIEEILLGDGEADLAEDVGLKRSLPHVRALATSMIALARSPQDYGQLRKSVSAWRAILDGSKDSAELSQYIDDVSGLIEHLQSVADSARLSNRNTLLLETLQLAVDLGRQSTEADTALNLQTSAALALQLTNVGQSSKAAAIFEQAQQIPHSTQSRSNEEIVRFLLFHSQFLIEIGDVEKADLVLHQAKEVGTTINLSSRSRSQKLMMAHASLLFAAVALGRGDAPCALTHARNASRVLFQEWARLEHAKLDKSGASANVSASGVDVSLAEAAEMKNKVAPLNLSGPEAWKLAQPVLTGLLSLSNTYAHLGMYQETVYYAEQAQKVAQAADSEAYLAECTAWMSLISARAGKFENALKSAGEIKLDGTEYSAKLVSLCCQLSTIYREVGEFKSEKGMLEAAEAMVKRMAEVQGNDTMVTKAQDTVTSEKTASKLAIKGKSATTAPRVRAPTTRTPAARTAAKNVVTKKPAPVAVTVKTKVEDAHLVSINASVVVERATSLVHQKDWGRAWQLLQEARHSSKLASNLLSELVTTARSLLGQSIDQMAKDAVCSVIQESPLSFPSVGNPNSDKVDRFSLIRTSPTRLLGTSPAPPKSTSQGYLENLREAREHLLEAHSMASTMGDGRQVHRILCTLQTVVILLSAASSSSRKAGILGHPGYATCSVEMARNLTWRREVKALLSEKTSGRAGLEWPEEIRSSEARRTSLSPVVDINKFQREYIDIIPEEWSVVSISLSDNKHDLCISKLQAGQNPFIIRLPIERATSHDADNEVFNFHEGRTELLEIIKRANATCHDKRDFSVKGAKTAWWAERSALDTQLRVLLEKIESHWLGGFKGIFSQRKRHPELLAKFQKSFQTILDKYLPSRRQVRGKKTTKPATSKVALDTRILELFIGLGDTSNEECDFDEMLNDLLYFVVDILQFNGERNAYDEIDFDTMVVETLDALHSYHTDAKNLEKASSKSHTILVLDKVLHAFPWESMSCLHDLAVSRVPSLACLRRLLLEQRPSSRGIQDGEQKFHHVSADNGTYILNPSGDLKTTQSVFEAPLASSLGLSWKSIQNKPPTEAEFETALSSSDILLYMGHGGGAQYIRNRQIRRLDKCRATALLMGCSSASLVDVGDFEVYGLVWSYMLAGCPAVVGTLWDVTDKDIDLYTGRLYEEWGLIKRGTFQAHLENQAGKAVAGDEAGGNKQARSVSRKRAAPSGEEGGKGIHTTCEYSDASLPEAVARARNSGVCKFKYLNAGAVCVYGIPVYVDRGSNERSGREA